MTVDSTLRDQAVAELRQTTRGLRGFTPPAGSHWRKALDLLAQIGTAPVTVIRDAPGLGINQLTRADLTDIVIDGTGDTGVLFQGAVNGFTADWSTIRRVRMTRVGELNSVGYGKHGIYGKAGGLMGEDIDMSLSRYCADGLSARYPSAWRRIKIRGEHQHAITYYETGPVPGTVLFEDVDATFNNPDAGIWLAPETNYQTQVHAYFVLRRVHLTGPSQWFLATDAAAFRGAVTLEDCTLNGSPVTRSNVRGVTLLDIDGGAS